MSDLSHASWVKPIVTVMRISEGKVDKNLPS
jgi:hypothetical protein